MSPVYGITLDDATASNAGQGYRRIVVVSIGRKWVEGLYPANVQKVRLPLDYFEANAEPVEFDKRRLATIIRDNHAFRSSVGLRTASNELVKAALKAIRS